VRLFIATLVFSGLFQYSCTMNSVEKEKVVVQGHRGCRGLLPENSLPAFERALHIGVSTLEMDVVLSADSLVVVSHEPFLNPEICTHPDGNPIQNGEAEALNIYQMRYDSLRQYPCGTMAHPRFPLQEQRKCYKPTLEESLKHIAALCANEQWNLPTLNIELKSRPEHYGSYQPEPEVFARLLHQTLERVNLPFEISLQSFDMNMLRALRNSYPEYTLVCLNERPEVTMDQLFAELGFVPEVYSPNYTMADQALVEECAARAIGLAVWTVNEEDDMRTMLELGVRNIITDYPDRLNSTLEEMGFERR
jgi:glycerophosphoryl diester phosphodiesterase